MKFSIIIPVYNVEPYIEQCIHSVLAQKNAEMQIILVDDGSTDASGYICDQYAHKYKQLQVIHQKNMGLSEARNTGIRHASGDYVLFIDADDYIAKDSVWHIEQEIINCSYPDLVFLECKKTIPDHKNHIKKCVPMHDGVTASIRGLDHGELLTYIAKLPKYPASAWAKAIKRELFVKHHLRFESRLFHEDLEWAVRLFLAVNSAGYCPADYYFYRQGRKSSISATHTQKNVMDILYIVEKWCSELNNEHTAEEKMMITSLMEYLFRFLSINIRFLPIGKRSAYRKRVHACASVLGIRNDNVSRYIRMSYKICGIDMTGWLLRLYLKIRTLKYRITSQKRN